MNWPQRCAAVIPCLNEGATIGTVVQAVRLYVPTVLVVDDGSSDETNVAAQQAGAEVLRLPATQGKGAALKRGWQQARERGFHWAVTLDGDGQHAPADIPAFFRCAERTAAVLVVGNRMTEPEKMPAVRRIVNRFMSHRISRLAGRYLPDSQCGFRLMDLNVWAGLTTRGAHFEVESEVLLKFARAGLRIEFVPIQVIYKTERSKIHPVLDTLRWLRWWQRAGSEGRVTRVPD